MTRPLTGVLTCAGDPAKLEEDKNKVHNYVKDNLFEWAVFAWNETAIKKGGVLHQDYLKNCQMMVAYGMLVNADGDAEAYMNVLWMMMEKDNSYHEWLSHKCFNAY
jgi:hypothetical protein